MAAGFPPDQPAAALASLGAARGAYLVFQLADIAYTAFNTLLYATVFALVLKRFGWTGSPARYSLLIPLGYAGAEIVENALLALMAAGLMPADGVFGLVQQLATNLKLATGVPAGFLTLAGLTVLLITALIGLVRRKPAPLGV